MYCIDIFAEKIPKYARKYNPRIVDGPNGKYVHVVCGEKAAKKLKKTSRQCGLKYRMYDRKYDRGYDYRETFFENTGGPYRCAYCGKKLGIREVEVDHVIPVLAAKKSAGARRMLKRIGADGVNDLPNLVAACRKCNRKKGSKYSFWWVLKGKHGNEKWFQALRLVSRAVVISAVACFLVWLATMAG